MTTGSRATPRLEVAKPNVTDRIKANAGFAFSPFHFSVASTLNFVGCLLITLSNVKAFGFTRDYAPHPGYIDGVDKELHLVYADLLPISPPKPEGPPLNQLIFNSSLIKEFRDRYEEKFGRTEVERVYNSPNRFSYYNDLYGFKGTAQEMDVERQRYGDFVLRRLAEFHVDNYAKNDPKVRPVWEAKEKLKEIKVEIASFRFDMNYSLAGNTFDLKLVNPYVSLARVRLQMNPGTLFPTPVQETIVSIGRPLTPTIAAETHYAVADGLLSFIERKVVSPTVGVSLTESVTTHDGGTSPRESKYLAGVAYLF